MQLRYIRDHDKREIDFVVLKEKKPLLPVECKLGDRNLSSNISYFAARTPIPAFYQVHLELFLGKVKPSNCSFGTGYFSPPSPPNGIIFSDFSGLRRDVIAQLWASPPFF